MKKILLFFFAALLAAGMSAFTSGNSGDVYFRDPITNQLTETSVAPCPENGDDPCIKPIPELGGMELPLFHQDGRPYEWSPS